MKRLAELSCGVSPSDRPTVAMAETTSNVTAFRPKGSMAQMARMAVRLMPR